MAFALVAHTKKGATGSGTSAAITTTGIDTTGATLLVVLVDWSTGGGHLDLPTLSDSKGNTWTPLQIQPTDGASNVGTVSIYYSLNPTVGASHTFSLTASSSFSAQSIAVAAFSGTNPSFDVQSGNSGGAPGTTTFQGGSLTPTTTNSLCICAAGVQTGQADVLSINSSYSTSDILGNGTNINSIGLFYLIQTSIVAENPTVTRSTSNGAWELANAVFKEGAAPLNIAIPVGSLATTTYAPTVNFDTPIPVGSLAITTYAPVVNISIPVPAGSMAFTTYAPTVGSEIDITVPVGTLAFTTYAPGVDVHDTTQNIPVPVGSMAITTYSPFIGIIQIQIPTAAMTFTTYAPGVHEPVDISVPAGALHFTTYAPRVFTGDLTPCAERFGPKLYYWEPSYLERPEDTFLRATDWENGGHQGLKFVQGLIIEADTEGKDRQILLQGDQLDIETITINHNGQIMKPYSLNHPVQKHLLRLWPQDVDPWRLFNYRWVFEPAPEFAKEWKTQGTDHDLPGYQFLKDGYIAHASTADITLNITVDDNVFSYIIPNSGGDYIKSYILFAIASSGLSLKGKLFTYELTSSAPFQLFQKDCEVRVHAWAGGDYMVKLPFGDIHRVAGARI